MHRQMFLVKDDMVLEDANQESARGVDPEEYLKRLDQPRSGRADSVQLHAFQYEADADPEGAEVEALMRMMQ